MSASSSSSSSSSSSDSSEDEMTLHGSLLNLGAACKKFGTPFKTMAFTLLGGGGEAKRLGARSLDNEYAAFEGCNVVIYIFRTTLTSDSDSIETQAVLS
jgi:hypothetical protein